MAPTEVERDCEVDVALRWGTGYDTEVRSFVNIIATPKGGTHVAGFEQALVKTIRKQLEANARRLKVRQGRQAREGRHPGRPDRRPHRPAGRAAVRGPDQGGPRHQRGARHRGQGRRGRADPTAHLDQARRQGPVGAAAGEGRRRDEVADQRAPAQGDPAPQERARDLVAAGQAGRLPQRRRRPQRAVHRRGRLRARHGQARARHRVPGAAADPRQDPQRAEGVGRPTCSGTPSAPRSSR